MSFPQSSCYRRRAPMPPLPEAIILVLAPFAPLFSHRVWLHAQVLLVGAMLAPGARTVTAALRVMGLAAERHFTNYHRVLNRATWSARQGSRMLLGLLITLLVPPGATIVFGADDTLERRSGRQIKAKGCYRDAVRSSQKHVIRCFGLKWVSMMLLVPVPWSQRLWALPFLTALCWPEKPRGPRRHKTSVDWVRQMRQQARRWLPGRRLVLVVDGGFATVYRIIRALLMLQPTDLSHGVGGLRAKTAFSRIRPVPLKSISTAGERPPRAGDREAEAARRRT